MEGFAKEMMREFNFMEGVKTIEDLKKKYKCEVSGVKHGRYQH